MHSAIVKIRDVEFSVDYYVQPQDEGYPAEIEIRSVETMGVSELRPYLADWVLDQIEAEIEEQAEEPIE